MPTAYLPDEDQGVLLAMVQLPSGSTLEQTEAVMEEVRHHFLEDQKEAVDSCMTIGGVGMAGMAQNQGMAYIKLRDWDLRNTPELRVNGIVQKAMPVLAGIREATIYAFPPPAVTELGTAKGFDFMLLDRGSLGHEKLIEARLQLMGLAMRDQRLSAGRPNGMPDTAQHKVDIDWEKAGTLGVSVPAIQSSTSVAFGSAYVNDFIQGGRVHRVYAQADAPNRILPEDLNHLYVRNAVGRMVPVTALASTRWIYDSPRLERYNGRVAILKSAAKLFARKGYEGASTREICEGAGITKPALYYHFRSKEHLFQELMLDCFGQYQKALLRSAKSKGNLRDKLICILDNHFREARKDPLRSRMVLRTVLALGDQPSCFNIAEVLERDRELVAGLFHDAIEAGEARGEPPRLAMAFMAISLSLILGNLLTPDRCLTRDSAEKYVDILLRGCSDAAQTG